MLWIKPMKCRALQSDLTCTPSSAAPDKIAPKDGAAMCVWAAGAAAAAPAAVTRGDLLAAAAGVLSLDLAASVPLADEDACAEALAAVSSVAPDRLVAAV